jgi:23S rRNA maturation-related 3'-5' exoribonuclease YhaM
MSAQEKLQQSNNIILAYKDLIELVSDRRNEVMDFERFLRGETCWTTSPASTRFHLAKEGGLIEHSLNVATTLLRLRTALAPDLTEESCVIVGLYHDIGKIGMPGKPYYLPNPSEWHVRNRGVNFIVNNGIVHMDIATRSLFLVSRHITLTEEEAQAIRYHDGQYIDENKSVAHKECKLTRLLQYADNWSGGVLEDESI